MNSISAATANSEMVFVELFQALSAAEDRPRVVAEFICRYPELEPEIRELAQLDSALENSPIATPPSPIPEQIGEYRIKRLIKIGGMGEIYEAYHERLDRHVALKIIRRGWTSEVARERFAREQHLLAKLHHSNIVPIQTGGEDGHIQFFTMPFILGTALNHVVDAAATISSSHADGRTPRVADIVGQMLRESKDCQPGEPPKNSRTSDTYGSSARPFRLSREYLESVARTMIEVAVAVDYAHRAGVLHRDLKPANVMIESSGHCWVIDFGLAAWMGRDENPAVAGCTSALHFGNMTNEIAGGTYNYMAPERWKGLAADERSDIFSLGAMLYELIALRPAYQGTSIMQIRSKILRGARVPARDVVKKLPKDLAAIADKAMHFNATLRYQNAADFAEDLRRWLRHKPIKARHFSAWERCCLWIRRKPTVATSLMLGLFGAMFLFSTIIDSYKTQLERDRLHHTLLGEHAIGWSDKAWSTIRKLAQEDTGVELRLLAAETRAGLDATRTHLWQCPASYLAYNSTGTKLLMVQQASIDPMGESTESANTHREVISRAQVWNSVSHKLEQFAESNHDGLGPIAYRKDQEPLQMVWRRQDPNAILLWNLEKREPTVRLECPVPLMVAPKSWSIVPNASIASAIVDINGDSKVIVWETTTAKPLAQWDVDASAIELSPDGQLMAVACANGRIEIWSVGAGERIASFSENHADILCFAWSKDWLCSLDPGKSNWLLAAGAYGGDIAIWDVEKKTVRAHCIGSSFEVFSLAFSPDGMTLASAGRSRPMLWDVATGQLLLHLELDNEMSSIVYSPTGDKLAVGAVPAWGTPGGTSEYELQEIRGQQVMRGLRSRVNQVRISAKNRYVAGLTDNWQLAVWDLASHRLLHVFQVPIGVYAETAGIAFDAEEQRVAFVAGREARIWNIVSGAVLKRIELPSGFLESLQFVDADTLLSARQESIDPNFPPTGPNPRPDLTPRECRVRNLLATEPAKPLLTISDFKRTAVFMSLAPSGDQLLVEGYYEGGKKPEHRLIQLYDVPGGRPCWEITGNAYGGRDHRVRSVDAKGRVIVMAEANMSGQHHVLVDVQSAKEIRIAPRTLSAVGPSGTIHVLKPRDEAGCDCLVIAEAQNDKEVLRFGLTRPISEGNDGVAISLDERYVAYGCSDGSVVVADLWSLKRSLTSVGLH